MNQTLKNIFVWTVLAVVIMVGITWFRSQAPPAGHAVPYSQFISDVREKIVSQVIISGELIKVTRKEGVVYTTVATYYDPHMMDDLLVNGVKVIEEPTPEQSTLMKVVWNFGPILLLVGLWWFFFMRNMKRGGGGPMGNFGASKARMLEEDQVQVTFADVAGCDEAKEEVVEMVDFLKDPAKFQKLGGKIPHGALLIGPPGTGKTLLARAIAGEAKVPFFTISGSDFVEMFVGVGASRVRDMFEQAKKHAPCIIFIDEIDAVGRSRGAGIGGGHDEREQTLNQLLVEMDGFEGNEGIIVIAATNRADVLDNALLRPGRFDRQVHVGLPDVMGRAQILAVHAKKVPCAEDVELQYLARGTPGFSGADLANLVNEAALFAARKNKTQVEMSDFEKAKDKILMGVERQSMVMSDEEKKITAYHEAGHAIVGWNVPEHDAIYKVSIMPRGRALGITMFLPERDVYSASKQKLESQISSLYGGRVAEEVIFGPEKVTTGASNDFERATALARNMVTKWGLAENPVLGHVTYAEEEGEVFLGRSIGRQKSVSDEMARLIDAEIRMYTDRNYERAERLLRENMGKLHIMAGALIKYETIDREQIADIMAERTFSPPIGWTEKNGGT